MHQLTTDQQKQIENFALLVQDLDEADLKQMLLQYYENHLYQQLHWEKEIAKAWGISQ